MARHDLVKAVSIENLSPETLAALDALRPGVHYKSGTCRRYRPMPRDFEEVFIRIGWGKAITEHYACNDRCITRWIAECGGDELRAKRAAASGRPFQSRRSRFPTYQQAVAAILRGEVVPALAPGIPHRRPQRQNDELHKLATDRGYRVRFAGHDPTTGEKLYRLRDRRDRPVRAGATVANTMAWLNGQPPVQW